MRDCGSTPTAKYGQKTQGECLYYVLKKGLELALIIFALVLIHV